MFSLRTHEKDNTGREKINPYMRVMVQGYPPVFIQGGKFYSEGGQEYDPLPPGIVNELSKCTSVALIEVGLDPDNPGEPLPPPREERVRATRPRVRPPEEELVEDEAEAVEETDEEQALREQAEAEAEAEKATPRKVSRKKSS